uniref:Uncharacterized protein n=1 Tax=Anguilla anguilla TaxID=7936 RepID=A0A0E9ULF9_ANGAN
MDTSSPSSCWARLLSSREVRGVSDLLRKQSNQCVHAMTVSTALIFYPFASNISHNMSYIHIHAIFCTRSMHFNSK